MICFIIHSTLINRLRCEGVARTRQAVDPAFHLLAYGALMINNTFHSLWDRLQQKTLNQQFTNRLIEGLNCSPFEANAILDTVYEVFAPQMDTGGQQGLGDIHILCTGIENSSAKPLKDATMVRVRLTLDGGEDDLAIRHASGTVALRRHRLERITHQAYQQGGLLTLEDIAYRLFNCGVRTLVRDMHHFREQSIVLPLRSTIKDMGRGISHRSLIIRHWLAGKEYDHISKATHHSPTAVANYVSKFKRCIWLAGQGFDTHTIRFLVGLSAKLTEHYWKLYREQPIAEHRRKQLQQDLSDQSPSLPQKKRSNER
ncbi:DUF1670 domain-containing protein [Rhodohalobacter halophilus]|uniref:DUF1670 domain-containing protein n=1 Tax=Rhodohalobacter halophilus TaxID=1812810 RepID=UPI00114CCD67|nr:DUF1670 domain-containing protein [Rhodohalobacter halophilus]